MRCPDCGQLLPDTARKCPSCGNTISAQFLAAERERAEMQNKQESTSGFDDSPRQSCFDIPGYSEGRADRDDQMGRSKVWEENCEMNDADIPREFGPYRSPSGKVMRIYPPGYENYKMKWYKFLTYVSLFLTGITNVASGVEMIMGWQYGAETGAQIYGSYPLLRPVDIIYGIITIGFGFFAIVLRQRLLRFKRNAPQLLLLMYVISLIITVVYFLIASLIIGEMLGSEVLIANAIASGVMIVLNKIYFDKRKSLFIG